MAEIFFIAPYDPKDWEKRDAGEVPRVFVVDIEKFSVQLKTRWPNAEIRYLPTDAKVLIDWSLLPADNANGLNGSLFSDYETLTIETGVEHDLVEFILWYRQFIPYEHNLYLFRSSSFERLELILNSSDVEVRKFALKR